LTRWLVLLCGSALAGACALGGEAKPRPSRDLSIEEVVRLAVERNLRLAAERLNPERAETAVDEERAAFDPKAFSELNASRVKQELRQQNDLTSQRKWSASAGIVKLFELGTTVEARLGASRDRNNLPNAVVNPAYDETAGVTLTQPLLRGFGVRVNTARIAASQNEQRIALAQLRQVALQTVSDARRAYWELVFAVRDRDLVRLSFKRGEELRDIVQTLVEAKVLAGRAADVGQAQAELAVRQEQLVVAEEAIRRVEDVLKVIIEMVDEPGAWPLAFVPTSQPAPSAPAVDPDEAMATALLRRPEYHAAQIAIGTRDIALGVARNELLPKLDLKASLDYMGLGSSSSRADHSFGTMDHYQWTAGLVFEYPLGNRAARARYRRATLERQQATLELRLVERQIQLEVRNAARALETALARLKAADESVRGQEERLRAQTILFKEGGAVRPETDGVLVRTRTTAQDVIFAQDSLSAAERRRLRALVDVNAASVELERTKGTLLDASGIVFVGEP